MNKKIAFIVCMVTLVIACAFLAVYAYKTNNDSVQSSNNSQPSPLSQTSDKLSIKAGTFFGMCAGYCKEEITISSEKIIYVKKDSAGVKPELKNEMPISTETWNALVADIDRQKINSLPETIGCPDCADQGGEWVEIIDKTGSKKVTFVYGSDIPEISNLIKEIRNIRIASASKLNDSQSAQ